MPVAVFQLKVTLAEIKPPIWRRFEVPGDIRLSDLHLVLQAVMGWENAHLHDFECDGKRYVLPDPEWPIEDTLDEWKFTLQNVVSSPWHRLTYEYDMGDSWRHELAVEFVQDPRPDALYSRCLDGARACPPEDRGGVWGYMETLEAVSNPDHPEFHEWRKRLGRDFDPEGLDLARVSAKLDGLRMAREQRPAPPPSSARTLRARPRSKRRS